MATIEKFENIDAWKEARKLCFSIHLLTEKEPFSKNFSLKDQILRSSGSAMDNIAEGFDRGGKKEFIQFLYISKASVSETKSQLYRALDFGYITKNEFDTNYESCNKIAMMIMGFIKYLSNTEYKGQKYSLRKT
jgi:four helix bundle protein